MQVKTIIYVILGFIIIGLIASTAILGVIVDKHKNTIAHQAETLEQKDIDLEVLRNAMQTQGKIYDKNLSKCKEEYNKLVNNYDNITHYINSMQLDYNKQLDKLTGLYNKCLLDLDSRTEIIVDNFTLEDIISTDNKSRKFTPFNKE